MSRKSIKNPTNKSTAKDSLDILTDDLKQLNIKGNAQSGEIYKKNPVIIKNISITENNFRKYASEPAFKKYLDLIASVYNPQNDIVPSPATIDSILNIFPNKPEYTVEFELHNTVSDLANAIRRCLVEELDVVALSADVKDIETDDRYILPDVVISQLESLPINQEIEFDANSLELKAINTSTEIRTVFSNSISISDKASSNSISVKDILSDNLFITKLHATKSIHIKHMKLIKGKALTDANSFTLLSNITYKILDINPKSQSSLTSQPSKFKLGYTTSRNISAKKPIIMCCINLIDRLESILKELVTDNPHGFHVEIEDHPDNLHHIYIDNEYWTMANLLSKYCYLMDNQIPFVAPAIVHPSTNKAYVKIKHNDWKNILIAAIKEAVEDLTIVKKAFM